MHKKRTTAFLLLLAVLTALAGCSKKDAAEPEPTDPLQRERFRLLAKVKQVAGKKHPEFAQHVGADVDKAIQAGEDAQYKIGSDLTDTGMGYRLYWVDQTFISEEFSAKDAPWEGIKADSIAYERRRAAPPVKPDVPSFTQAQTFARGWPYFIVEASVGDPPGTLLYGKEIQVRVRIRRGAQAVPAALMLQLPTPSGSAMMFAYPDLTKAPPEQELTQTYKWTRLDPGSTLYAVLAMVEAPGGSGAPSPLSNPAVVKFRVAVKPPAGQ